ncbi:hypothetical protein [Mycoplasma sp. HU2014]|uniref:hypothetical protein n=1 Tax=Mycoplasma sp. HU2014 TaxID=1664275 RepID=UPI00067E468F|nr:hypothetical protein [Mycoplasma sp. HU2014]KNG79780.1 hypothetical protein AB668_02210 [Mycoplasma sp. HU2014]MBY7704667.1 hypothetical protein [Vibrio harveyi]
MNNQTIIIPIIVLLSIYFIFITLSCILIVQNMRLKDQIKTQKELITKIDKLNETELDKVFSNILIKYQDSTTNTNQSPVEEITNKIT